MPATPRITEALPDLQSLLLLLPQGVVLRALGPENPGVLLPAEQALLSPDAAPERQRAFALGRACARAALGALRPEWLQQPVLRHQERMPRWPEGVVGAITHAGEWAVAAVAPSPPFVGLGVDLERRRAVSPRLWRRILHPTEQQQVQPHLAGSAPGGGAPAADPLPEAHALDFLLRFSMKEAIYKALYPHGGVYLGFHAASILPPPGAQGRHLGAGGWEAAESGVLRWQLHQGCGPDFPLGMTGQGAFVRQGGWVLTAVWV